MSTTTGSITFFHSYKQKQLDGTIVLDTHTLKVAFCTSVQALTAAGQSVYADLTNELTTANGYTAGGQTLAGVALTTAAGVAKFDATDPVLTATGGNLTAFYWVLYDDTAATKPLICFGLLDTTAGGTAVTITDGNPITYIIPAGGFFTLT